MSVVIAGIDGEDCPSPDDLGPEVVSQCVQGLREGVPASLLIAVRPEDSQGALATDAPLAASSNDGQEGKAAEARPAAGRTPRRARWPAGRRSATAVRR